MAKRILFLSPFFYPEEISTGKYNSFLVEKLIGRGFDVDVVCMFPFYPEWKIRVDHSAFHGANIYRYGKLVKFPKSQIFRRLLLELIYGFFVFKHLLFHKSRYSDVISIFPPVMFDLFSGAFFPVSKKRIGIVHDVQGIMAKTESSFVRRLAARLMAFVESNAYKRCDMVVCLSRSMKEVLVNEFGVAEDKCVVFYPFVSSLHQKAPDSTDELDSIFTGNYKHVVYSGALGEKQKPGELYQIMTELCKSNSGIRCHIFSRGPLFTRLLEMARDEGNDSIEFHDLVKESQLSELYSRSDVQIIPQAPGTGAGAFPSKLPNLLAHGVPVFAICDKNSELYQVLGRARYSKVIHNWDSGEFVTSMEDFLDEIQRVSHDDILNHHKANILAEFDVEKFIDTLVG